MTHVMLIGAGTMGRTHALCYAKMENAKLTGIVEARPEKGEELAQSLGCPVFPTLDAALASLSQVDVIDVCLPTFLHKEYVMAAADAGKHVICEKPLAGSLEDAREMIDHCKAKGVRLFVGHVLRFFHEYERAKQLLDDGVIGDVSVARTFRGGGFPAAWNNWYNDFAGSGGLTLDMIIHDFDILRWYFGDVQRVYAKGLYPSNPDRMDYSLVTLRFQNGVIAHVEGSWAHQGFGMKLEIAGKKGILDYDSTRDRPVTAVSRKAEAGFAGVAVPESPVAESPYYKELAHFLACLVSDTDPLVTAEDAYRAMEISLAAIASMKSGKPVTLGVVPVL
ncbi:Gfo/Idh/MocA family protein [Paenibacillus xerothermodurans]|uniref:Gfo/Idh/MocA family oxidoreductase n=1 Tax=Paenibacillus xerothermodurans TaxID=1977292 RepID=A0A2W1NRX3_PAEXE|nr:Gfo/Idh/MocA family oxidoreductase [Paenibacillus xerothermodurans]PZE20506.1 gfo/Idh/MocA family oxidoreductase [Paenibacillus xerothermodurans]